MPIENKPAISTLVNQLLSLTFHARRVGQDNQAYAHLLAERIKHQGGREITRQNLVALQEGLRSTLSAGGKGIPESLTSRARSNRLRPFERKARRLFADSYLGPDAFKTLEPPAQIHRVFEYTRSSALTPRSWVNSVRQAGGFQDLSLLSIRMHEGMISSNKLIDLLSALLGRINQGRKTEQSDFRDFSFYVEAVLNQLRIYNPRGDDNVYYTGSTFHQDVQRAGWNLEDGAGIGHPFVKSRTAMEYGMWKQQLLNLLAVHLPSSYTSIWPI